MNDNEKIQLAEFIADLVVSRLNSQFDFKVTTQEVDNSDNILIDDLLRGQTTLIDDTEDADATNTHGKAAAVAAKPKPKITVEQFNKAKDYLKNGGKLEAIKTKYTLTSKQEEQLAAL